MRLPPGIAEMGWDLALYVRIIGAELRRGRGVRVGESTVVSRRVHTISPQEPGTVRINTSSDAGQVFYNRRVRNEILHIDVFHQVAEVNHKMVAEVIKKVTLGGPNPDIANLIDVQTATGGGRVSGSLAYGTKLSLRKAHSNHVHIAAMLRDEQLELVFPIMGAVEEEIISEGLEIRKVETIRHLEGCHRTPMDLSPYSSLFDSHLREGRAPGLEPAWEDLDYETKIEIAVNLADEFGGTEDLTKLIDVLDGNGNPGDGGPFTYLAREYGDVEETLDRLVSIDIANRDSGRIGLTSKGRALREFLRVFRTEVEAGMRRLLRKVNTNPVSRYESTDSPRKQRRPASPRKSRRTKKIDGPGLAGEEIAVPETIQSAALRSFTQEFRVAPEDIQVHEKRSTASPDICLLVDASASMVGKRIKAARQLVRHLSLVTDARVAVITFQERNVDVIIPPTRNRRAIAEGLSGIRPAGLTPLAAGISETLEFLRAKRMKNVALVLLTDGIPTMNKWTQDPSRDALTAAEEISRSGIGFICVGLQPNKEYLKKLVATAGGRLYIVDEFNREVLAELMREERRKNIQR